MSDQNRRTRRIVVFSIAFVSLAACERPAPESRADSGAVDSPAVAAARTPADSQPECPQAGLWRQCSIEKRLERAGLVAVRQEGEVRHPFLDVAGTAYVLGRDELEVFIYPSAEARERDLADIDTATVAPPGEPGAWDATPTLIVSNNLAAILIGGTSRQVERVQLAITAGLPRPEGS